MAASHHLEIMARSEVAGRTLALILVAAMILLAYGEAHSPAALAVLQRKPYLLWLAVPSPATDTSSPPRLTLALYQPSRRTLDLLLFPATLALAKRQDLAAAYRTALRLSPEPSAAARRLSELSWMWLAPQWTAAPTAPHFVYWENASDAGFEPAADLKFALQERGDRLRFWKNLIPILSASPGLPLLDRVVLAREWHGLKSRDIRCAWLPEDPPQTAALLARLLSGSSPATIQPQIVAEVLNATGKKGMASEVSKVLRSKGVDVVYFGNASERRRTIIYDRLGSIETARKVADLLGCPQAEPVTQVNIKKLVDVTVVLGEDCAWN